MPEYILRYREPYHKAHLENSHDELLQWNVREHVFKAEGHAHAQNKANDFLVEEQTSGESKLPNRQPISLISVVQVWDHHDNLRLHQ